MRVMNDIKKSKYYRARHTHLLGLVLTVAYLFSWFGHSRKCR